MSDQIADNLVAFRKKAKLSQQRLAELVGVTRQSISNYEKKRTVPDGSVLERLALALNIEIEELVKGQRHKPTDAVRYRKDRRKLIEVNYEFEASVFELGQKYRDLEESLGIYPYTPPILPCYEIEEDEGEIKKICKEIRKSLGLGDEPIGDLFALMESKGLKIIRVPVAIRNFFGLSLYTDDFGAFVLINSHEISIERQIFTLAHEIGHLVCHRNEYNGMFAGEGSIIEEKIADIFAANLLVPESEFNRKIIQLSGSNQTKNIVELKRHFNVSYQVILRRFSEQEKNIEYGRMQAKICGEYKRRHGKSLKRAMELPPVLTEVEVPLNQRFRSLLERAFEEGKISPNEYVDFYREMFEQSKVL